MLDRLPKRLRLGSTPAQEPIATPESDAEEVVFVAYGEDCILSGRAVLDTDRLTDMLNAHDEYVLARVMVERFDGGEVLEVDEIAVPRDEIFLVHASGPRGDAARRTHTMPDYLAVKVGPYEVRGYFHGLPGADPIEAMRRRRTMVPLTDARIDYTFQGEPRHARVDTVIVNREQIDWVEAVLPSQIEFPAGPDGVVGKSA